MLISRQIAKSTPLGSNSTLRRSKQVFSVTIPVLKVLAGCGRGTGNPLFCPLDSKSKRSEWFDSTLRTTKENASETRCRLISYLIQGKEERWKVLLCQIEIVWVFSLPLMFDAIENHALDGCPGIEKEGRFQRRKAMGRERL